MSDTHFRSAPQFARDIKSCRISSRELLDLYFARSDKFNLAPTAIIVQQRGHDGFGARTAAITGKAHPHLNRMLWPGCAGVAMLAATVIPAVQDVIGVPISMQIIGAMNGDLKTVQLAQFQQRAGFALQTPPAYL